MHMNQRIVPGHTGLSARIREGLLRPLRWSGVITADWWMVFAIILVNAGMFWKHYSGTATFPWDFIGGYHAQAVGWYREAGLTSLPAWMPWGDMGFPSFLALQSGAWYIPLQLLDALGVQYTFRVATALQAAHVAVGGIGAYALMRSFGLRPSISMIGALSYHFSAAFFSGQQFVDIVRAAAIMPWILFFLNPRVMMTRRWVMVPATIMLFQFLVAAYPGNIVSAVYTCGIFCLTTALLEVERSEFKCYAWRLSTVIVSAALLSMLKWYPLLSHRAELIYVPFAQNKLEFDLLTTLLLPYDSDIYPSDVAMRSVWLPMATVWGVFFARPNSTAERVSIAIILLSVLMAAVIPMLPSVGKLLPGTAISRFLVSDWRPSLQIGLGLLGACGWQRALSRQYSLQSFVGRSSMAAMFAIAIVLLAIHQGMPAGFLSHVLVFIGIMTAMIAIVVMLLSASSSLQRTGGAVALMTCALVVVDSAWFHSSQNRTWEYPWNEKTEAFAFGDTVNNLLDTGIAQGRLNRRPERYVYGEGLDAALAGRKNPSYNRCWYEGSFCMFGYNNLRMSRPHQDFESALSRDGGEQLLAFASRKQQLLAVLPGQDLKIAGLDHANVSDAVIGPSAHLVRSLQFLGYEGDIVRYRVQATKPLQLVENELWWPGWTFQLCDDGTCRREMPVGRTPQALRSWQIPEGTWNVVLRFHERSYSVAVFSALLGAILVLVAQVLPGWSRFKADKQVDKNTPLDAG